MVGKVSATVSESVPIETAHEDMIVSRKINYQSPGRSSLVWPLQHDAQLDYYGKRLATCSSDRTVKVFDVIEGDAQHSGGSHVLKGCVFNSSSRNLYSGWFRRHTGPVWQVSWAHPKYGHILASCSYDGKVLIWKEQQGQAPAVGAWNKVKEHTLHSASGMCYPTGGPRSSRNVVNSVSWAPHELGAILACASSDGKLSVLTFKSTF